MNGLELLNWLLAHADDNLIATIVRTA